jgi:hypothetical protein
MSRRPMSPERHALYWIGMFNIGSACLMIG